MKKNNNSKEKAQKFATGIRARSEAIRSIRSGLAKRFVEGIKEGVDQCGDGIDILQAVVDIYKNVQRVATAIVTDDGVKTKVLSLVENTIDDVASRMNEFSGIVDYVSKSETLISEFDNLSDNLEDIEKRMSKVSKRKKTNLHVVDPDETSH